MEGELETMRKKKRSFEGDNHFSLFFWLNIRSSCRILCTVNLIVVRLSF